MNLRYVLAEAQKIKDLVEDPEVAHGLEDNLMYDFIQHITDVDFYSSDRELLCELSKIVVMAEEIAKVQSLSFERWYT